VRLLNHRNPEVVHVDEKPASRTNDVEAGCRDERVPSVRAAQMPATRERQVAVQATRRAASVTLAPSSSSSLPNHSLRS